MFFAYVTLDRMEALLQGMGLVQVCLCVCLLGPTLKGQQLPGLTLLVAVTGQTMPAPLKPLHVRT